MSSVLDPQLNEHPTISCAVHGIHSNHMNFLYPICVLTNNALKERISLFECSCCHVLYYEGRAKVRIITAVFRTPNLVQSCCRL